MNTLHLSGFLEAVKTNSLIPFSLNAKKHTPEQIAVLEGSIEEAGYYSEIVIDENNMILCGHGRWQAILKLGYAEVEVRRLSGLSESQKIRLNLRDNFSNSMTGYDEKLIGLNLEKIQNLGGDIELLGLSGDEVQGYLRSLDDNIKLIDAHEDGINQNEVARRVKKNELWQLGNHYLLCGDSLDSKNLDRLMQGKLAHLVFCDPPYNLAANDITHQEQHEDFVMAAGEMSKSQFIDFLKKYMQNCVQFSVNGSIHYHCMDWRHIEEIIVAGKHIYKEEGYKNLCVWAKDVPGMGSFYRSQHELVFIFKKGDAKHTVNFGYTAQTEELKQRTRSNIWKYAGQNSFGGKNDEGLNYGYNLKLGKTIERDHLHAHPTPKPLELVIDAILDCSNENECVLDLFGGSGTTLIAAEKTGRNSFLMEYEEKYCDYILTRWEKLTGKKAVKIN